MKYFLDTNSIIYAINSALSLPNNEYYISFITELELLSYPKLTDNESVEIKRILSDFIITGINNSIKQEVVNIRKDRMIKLPD